MRKFKIPSLLFSIFFIDREIDRQTDRYRYRYIEIYVHTLTCLIKQIKLPRLSNLEKTNIGYGLAPLGS